MSLPTGTIFGVWDGGFLGQTARAGLVAAGYALYSSSTELVIARANCGPARRFVLADGSFRDAGILYTPTRGPYYSLNDAREPDWPAGLRRWVADATNGTTPAGVK